MADRHQEDIDTFVRETCEELDGKFDRAAVQLITSHGIFCADDLTPLDQLFIELAGDDADQLAEICGLQDQLRASTTAAGWAAFQRMQDIDVEVAEAKLMAAYLLGISVGRRLGGAALSAPTKAVKQAPVRRKAVR